MLSFFLSSLFFLFSLCRWLPEGLGWSTFFDAYGGIIFILLLCLIVHSLWLLTRYWTRYWRLALPSLIGASLVSILYLSSTSNLEFGLSSSLNENLHFNSHLSLRRGSHCIEKSKWSVHVGDHLLCSSQSPQKETTVFDPILDGNGHGRSQVFDFEGSEPISVAVIDQKDLDAPMARRAAVQRAGTLLRNSEKKIIVIINWRVSPFGPSRKKLMQLLRARPLQNQIIPGAFLPKYRVEIFGRGGKRV